MKKTMERILGATIQSTEQVGIKGLQRRDGAKVVFCEVSAKTSPAKVFREVTNATSPPYAKSGGAAEYGCSVRTPDGVVYHAIALNGDVDGWEKDIRAGAKDFGYSFAQLDGELFLPEGLAPVALGDCEVLFH